MKFLMIVDPNCYHLAPSQKTILDSILENNREWKTVPYSGPGPRLAIECEKKPCDLPTYGISWKQVVEHPTREHAATLTEEDLLAVENDPEYAHLHKNA